MQFFSVSGGCGIVYSAYASAADLTERVVCWYSSDFLRPREVDPGGQKREKRVSSPLR